MPVPCFAQQAMAGMACARRAWPAAWPECLQLMPASRRQRLFHSCWGVRCAADLNTSVLVDQTYAELELKSIQHQVGGVRVRQHVNPLKASLMAPVIPPAWETEFADPTLPLMVDIGCGSGRFLMVLAKRSLGSCNFLGLDVREKLLQRSKLWVEELSLSNIHFMVANATVGLDAILSTYPGKLTLVSILCPDPHFKMRHRKRRIVQKSLVDAVVKHLTPGGQIFLQSDVEEVAVDMRDQFDEQNDRCLLQVPDLTLYDEDGWLKENPLGVATEREIHAIAQGEKIYRILYRRL